MTAGGTLPQLAFPTADCCFAEPRLLTDYDTLCAPHVAALQAILAGRQGRYKLPFEDATFIFDAGCLMGRVWREGRSYALPPLALDHFGLPYFYAIPATQRAVWSEFCQLPKSILLFYCTLLKKTTGGGLLSVQDNRLDPAIRPGLPLPVALHPWLDAVAWPYVSAV